MNKWQHPEINQETANALLKRRELEIVDGIEQSKTRFLNILRSEYGSCDMVCLRDQPTPSEKRYRSLCRVNQHLKNAQKKITKGEWGICQECGEPIPAGRLRIRPEAKKCAICKTITNLPPGARAIAEMALFDPDSENLEKLKDWFGVDLTPFVK